MITNLVSNTCNSLIALLKRQKTRITIEWIDGKIRHWNDKKNEVQETSKSCTGATSDPPKAPMR